MAAGDAGDTRCVILQSAISSASSSARWIDSHRRLDVDHHALLQPLRFVLAEADHLVACPSAITSATTATTFEVPMSRPTIRFLASFVIACLLRVMSVYFLPLVGFADEAHASGTNRQTVRIAHVRISISCPATVATTAVNAASAACSRSSKRVLVALAPQLHLHAVVQLDRPRVARRQPHFFRRQRQAARTTSATRDTAPPLLSRCRPGRRTRAVRALRLRPGSR